ncbi:MAG: nucleoside-diphosphate kinase, partial [bacterium]|nr:nucleoside-diphosphate kinase [bacterium]
ILEGNHSVKVVRKMIGSTSPGEANPGTIRGDYSLDTTDLGNAKSRPVLNLVHASGSAEEAKFEEELWFHKNEIHSYKRVDEDLIYG